MNHEETGPVIEVHYLGHASFLLRFGGRLTVLCDYGAPNAWIEWGWNSPIHDIGRLVPDVLTTSHDHHADHCDPERAPSGILHRLTEIDRLDLGLLSVEPIRTSEKSLDQRDNTSFLFAYQGFRILHLGDCQAEIQSIEDEEQRKRVASLWPEPVDLLLMPIESQVRFTEQAVQFAALMRPRCLVPMHYWSEESLAAFLCALRAADPQARIEDAGQSMLSFPLVRGPARTRVVRLQPAPFRGWPV